MRKIMEQKNKAVYIPGRYFPCLADERNNIVLKIRSVRVPISIQCEIAKALEFMGDKVHLIIDRCNRVLYVLPNYNTAQWQQTAKQSPVWRATYEDDAMELLFDGTQSKHQKLKDELLATIVELANKDITEERIGVAIKGSFSYKLGGLYFPLNRKGVVNIKWIK